MKKHLRASGCLLLLLLFQYPSAGQSLLTLPSAKSNSRSDVTPPPTLKAFLKKISDRLQVSFIYEAAIGGQLIGEAPPSASVDKMLSSVLPSLDLSFKKVGEQTYVIKPLPAGVPLPDKDAAFSIVELTGRVTDRQSGVPLPGVNVIVKGTATGSVTNAAGYYRLQIAADTKEPIVYSSVGYQAQEVIVSDETNVEVALVPQVKELNEVVVIGYGARAKQDVTGAVEFVSAETINDIPAASFDQLLGGRVAGVQALQNSGQPGGNVSVRVRGINSINASGEPLYVIDGVPVAGTQWLDRTIGFAWAGGEQGQTTLSALSFLNPDDIATISVLKDASATAIYGARGANGVVNITTRRGRVGPAQVRFNTSYGFQQVPKKLDVMDWPQYMQYQRELQNEGWVDANELLSHPPNSAEGTRWQDEIFRTTPVQNYGVSVSGGDNRTQYAAGGGYFRQSGIVIGSDFDRYSLRLNLDHRARRWLKIGNSLMASRLSERIVLSDATDGVISQSWLTAPNVSVREPNGTFAGPPPPLGSQSNPVALALTRDLEVTRLRVLGNIYAEATLSPRLRWRSELGGDFRRIDNNGFEPTYQWGRAVNKENQSHDHRNISQFWQLKNYLNYHHTWADRHRLTLLGGQEVQELRWAGTGEIRQRINETDQVGTAAYESWKESSALVSYFGRLNYDFDDRYWLTATLRADGSSKFGPANRWGVFPSFALAWKVHKEDFMMPPSIINELKLRFGYGEVGNQNIENYAYGTPLTTVSTQWGTGYRPSRYSNSQVKWEATTQLNVGLDIGLWDHRFRLVLDAYQKRTQDMLVRQPLPYYLGTHSIGEPWINQGELENQGFEFTIATTNVSRRMFSWTTQLTFTHNRNRLISLGDQGVVTRNVKNVEAATRTEVGQPLGQFYGYEVDGIFRNAADIENSPQQGAVDRTTGVWVGDIRFKNNDPTPNQSGRQVIDAHDRTYIGDPNPDFVFGLTNAFAYHRFDVTVLLRGAYGHDIYNYARSLTEGIQTPGANQLATVLERARVGKVDAEGGETVDNYRVINPEAHLPRAASSDPNGNNRLSDRHIEDGSFLRVQHVALGYSPSAERLSRWGITQLRAFVSVQNLYTFTGYRGLDPEVGAFDQDPLLQGIDNGQYPAPRTISFGFNITL